MCGIFCAITNGQCTPHFPPARTEELLRQRGPDSYNVVQKTLHRTGFVQDVGNTNITFAASVLSLRGDKLTPQPITLGNDEGVLCWNGEAWSCDANVVEGSDTAFVAEQLLLASRSADYHGATLDVFANIRGPYAFVYYDKSHCKLYFGRDCIGRRSLLRTTTSEQLLVLSSVADMSVSSRWEEVEADGVYVADLASQVSAKVEAIAIAFYPYSHPDENLPLPLPWGGINTIIPDISNQMYERVNTESCESLCAILDKAVRLRLTSRVDKTTPAIAVLFSGGLDCTVLARIAHDHLPNSTSIDLLNVAFENPRIHRSLTQNDSPYELCPDRITARQSLAELQRICPRRQWNLICINIPYPESTAYKPEILRLIHPHDTEMDVSIAMALFFAARGPTESKFLLSGLGADELFGGYQRHALAYSRGGYGSLIEELELDVSRLGKRNLGRDDRVISRWGKEARFPYLDEEVVEWAMAAGIWEKVGFGFEKGGVGDVMADDKLVVRCVAKRLGMGRVAEEKKRAIQFGTRSAKMERGRVKGTEKVV